jgi:tetratricopeptide (TPR) repeat protein
VPRQTASHIDSPEALGRRLRQAREAALLRQGDIAFEHCSAGYVSLIEAGRRIPSLQVIRELAVRLGVTEDWLATGRDEERRDERGFARLAEADLALRLDDVERAREIFGSLAAPRQPAFVRARAEAGLGQLEFRDDHARQAIEHLEAAYELDPQLDDASAADTLGRAYARVGEEELAIALFRARLREAAERGDVPNRTRFSVLLANALIDVSQFSEAAEILSEAIADEQAGDPLHLARLYWSQSRLHALRGETESATRFARKALGILETTEHRLYTARAYQMLAYIELDAGRAEEALRAIRRGRELLAGIGTDHDATTFELEEARALALLGHLEHAAALAMRSAAGFRDAHPLDAGRSFAQLAAVCDREGDNERAIELYELAIELLERQPNRYLAEAYAAFGSLLERVDRREDAYAVFKRAAGLRAALDQPETSFVT